MIILKTSICLLAYLQLTTSQPVEISASPQQYKLPLALEANPEEINNLSVVTAGDIQEPNEDIDSLIEKVKEVTSRYKKDVDGTIAEVQQILEEDYSLPRLTRGEIVEILDNLTKADIEELRRHGVKSRKDYQRALMLVMPYTSKDSKFNVEELYTKAPITHIIGAVPVKVSTPKMNIEIMQDTTSIETSTAKPTTVELPRMDESTLRTPFKRPTVTETPRLDESTLRTPSFKRPSKIESAEYDESTLRTPSYKRPTKFEAPKTEQKVIDIEITTPKPKKQFKPTDFSVSTHRPYNKPTRFANHKYNDDGQYQANQGFRVVSPPSYLSRPNNAESWEKPSFPSRKNKPSPNRHTMQSSVYKAPLSSTSRPRYRTTTTTTTESVINIGVPEEMKELVKDIQMAESAKTKNKYSSQYVASETKFQKQSTTENIQDILGAIGGTPPAKIPDLSGVADTLTPEMKELLMSFGLIEDPNKSVEVPAQVPIEPETLDIRPVSYTQFKPLPDTAPSRDDMFEFLSSYGLVGSSGRSSKKIKEYEPPKHLYEVPAIDMEMIPESMHSVLEDIGLSQPSRRGKRIEIDEPSKIYDKTHVFNPVESNVSNEELKRLNQLMETLVRLEKLNRTVTEEDFRDIDLDNIAEITKILGNSEKVIPLDIQTGPDPINYNDYGLEKNEVKRQETTTVKEEETTTTTTTTEEPKNPPIEALAESFGGVVTTKAEDATLPPPRKTGFYYLVDWNTFLEVGEEGKNRVNIRFSPRAGDPSRFLKVTVP